MSRAKSYDAVVVGAGPNGLAAAIAIARAGRSVLVIEASETIGGGARSAALTLPGFVHDICSAIQPLTVVSPFLRTLPLDAYGLEWINPPAPLAHPLDDGSAVVIERSVDATAANLGADGAAYRRLMGPLVAHADDLLADLLGPLPLPPRHPLLLARFGLNAWRSARGLARAEFRGERARAIFAGLAAHAMLPLDQMATAAFGMVLGVTAHAVGWPMARGGAQRIADAMGACLRSLGGDIVTGVPVTSLAGLPQHRAVLFDVTPRQLLHIVGGQLSGGYRRSLEHYRYGPGVFKIDWALDGPVPWTAPQCNRAATVHLGGTLAEIEASENAIRQGKPSAKPYTLIVQHSLFDPERAPAGKATLWGYCHVPHGSTVDMTDAIEGQIERFAPGFRSHVLARSIMPPAAMEQHNANNIGGDINGGVQDIRQLYTRPAARINPYTTPAKGIYICSSSTPPGGGVHGMCGYFAARAALRELT
jgi:phytoene dehydrogenase-like protein